MASSGGIWVPMAQRVLRQALTAGTKITKGLRSQIAAATRGGLEPAPVRSSAGAHRQPVHPRALRRQRAHSGGARWYATAQTSLHGAVRRFFSSSGRPGAGAARYVDRTAHLGSRVGAQAVWRAAGRAPFASTLRPSLTGGALPRTAGGYATGGAGRGGARYFSHTPAAPAQVVHSVSQAMRAFWAAGRRARFSGVDAQGRAAYTAVSALEEDVARRLAVPAMPARAPGAFVDFPLSPTITALAGFGLPTAAPNAKAAAAAATTLGTEGFLDVLSVDFARALKALSAIMNDLRRLAALGDLPVLLDTDRGGQAVLRVRFPGVDAGTVDRLCEDLGVTRGLVGQDPGFDLAVGACASLRFPFAPDAAAAADGYGAVDVAPALTSPGGSLRSHQSWLSSDADELEDVFACYDAAAGSANPWLASVPASSADGYASLSPPVPGSGEHMSQEFEGLEGVYRFLEACDRVQEGSRRLVF